MEVWYYTGKLVEALIAHGIVGGKSAKAKAHEWVYKAEKAGSIKPFKAPTHSGKLLRRFRQRDIDQIVKAFSVGGSGHWEPEPVENE